MVKKIEFLLYIVGIIFALSLPWVWPDALAATPPSEKSKFYDFSEQIVNGEIRKPTALYTSARQKAKFDRLLKLKKSFLPKLFQTSKEKIFK